MMKIYAKMKNDKIAFCPQNGYVEGFAVSNLPKYFEANPDIADSEGWKEFVPYDGENEGTLFYEEIGDKIYERVKHNV